MTLICKRENFTFELREHMNHFHLTGVGLPNPSFHKIGCHGAQLYDATIKLAEGSRLLVTISERDQGIAPGQFAVFYDGLVCVGSGMIIKAL